MRPQVPREPTLNKLRTNSERTPNELRQNSEQTPNELRTNSERTPNKLRANSGQTPNENRTNSGRTRNKLRTSEQAPSELWHCSRANSERTLAISMCLSLSMLVAKRCLFFLFFFGLSKRGQVITGASFKQTLDFPVMYLSGWIYFPDKRQTNFGHMFLWGS